MLGNWAPERHLVQLTLILCCTISWHLRANSQQFSPDFQGNQQQQVTSAAANGAHKISLTTSPQKVGMAPHDRPSCQLPPIAAQRRQLASQQPTNPFAEELLQTQLTSTAVASETTTQEQQVAVLNGSQVKTNGRENLAISAPDVVSLQVAGDSAVATTAAQVNTGANAVGTPLKALARKFDSSERLRQLRQLLTSNNYDAYLVTPNDEHGSEYVSEYDRRLRFISGFTGSNGYALVMLDRAVLFTDGRYALQADLDLDCNWWLVVSHNPIADIHLWLKANAAKGIKIAIDARLMSLQSFDYLNEHVQKLDSEFVLISQDLIDVVWNNADLPIRLPPQGLISVHPLQFAGNVTWQEKLVKLAYSMIKLKARHYVVSQLDDIAWLLNLRGNDIPRSPLFKAYLFISHSPATELPATMSNNNNNNNNRAQPKLVTSVEQLLTSNLNREPLQAPQVLQVQPSQTIRVTFYVDLKKIDQNARNHLHVDNGTVVLIPPQQQQRFAIDTLESQPVLSTRIQVELKDYDVFIMDIRDKFSPAPSGRQLQGKLLLNAQANVAVHVLAKAHEDRIVLAESLVSKLKSVRSDGEVQGMRLAHWRDSLAISMLLTQLEHDIGNKGLVNKWTETSAASELEFYRSLMDYNRGQSFDTISAYGSNAAIVHYAPLEEERRSIGNQSTYLLDSGGQYLDGTTDITRTMHYGEPSDFQRETYTRVLMGAVDMMSLIFDQSSRHSFRINDLLARRHLFEIGLDYMHGTGHGIGVYSLVHESPPLIEQYTRGSSQRQTNSCRQQNNVGQQQQQPLILSDPVPLRANMFTSVEPGYYKANDFGIRLENIVVTQRVNLPSALVRTNDRQETKAALPTADKQFLRFEPISLVPFELKLIKLELLSNKQKAWLNSYNLMVRLRMTQQINYYLAKIRQAQAQSVQVQGTAFSSRIYQHLLSNAKSGTAINGSSIISGANNGRLSEPAQLGYYNFLRLDGGQFQEKLEQTHKWILSKTELIPLDVPQSLVAPQLQAASGSEQVSQNSLQSSSRRRMETADESSPININNQRLVLAYMSSLPFNDPEAGEKIASLGDQLSGRGDNASSNASSANGLADSATGSSNKCSGYECDLWLLGSLNPNRVQRHRAAMAQGSWPPESMIHESDGFSSSSSLFGSPSTSSLMDLFQLNGSNRGVSLNIWSLLAVGLLVTIQMSVVTYACRSGFNMANLCPATSSGGISLSQSSQLPSAGSSGTVTVSVDSPTSGASSSRHRAQPFV